MQSLRLIAALAFCATSGLALAAGDAASGKNKVYQCQGCHGIPDWKTAFPEVYRVPKLGGQKPEYIVAALKAYKKGERDFGTMRAISSLSTYSAMTCRPRLTPILWIDSTSA